LPAATRPTRSGAAFGGKMASAATPPAVAHARRALPPDCKIATPVARTRPAAYRTNPVSMAPCQIPLTGCSCGGAVVSGLECRPCSARSHAADHPRAAEGTTNCTSTWIEDLPARPVSKKRRVGGEACSAGVPIVQAAQRHLQSQLSPASICRSPHQLPCGTDQFGYLSSPCDSFRRVTPVLQCIPIPARCARRGAPVHPASAVWHRGRLARAPAPCSC
jgi:hypothetical protein